MKTCNKCKLEKPRDEFSKRARASDGLRPRCKKCESDASKVYRERVGPQKLNAAQHRRKSLRLHSLSEDEYNRMLEAQGGGCAICGKTSEENGRNLSVDHDHSCCPGKHSCGKCIRGLLCNAHNVALGLANDSIEELELLIKYLSNAKKG